MSDSDATNQPSEKPQQNTQLPPQVSPQDTSNWDDREFTTPTGRVVIETREDADDDVVVAE